MTDLAINQDSSLNEVERFKAAIDSIKSRRQELQLEIYEIDAVLKSFLSPAKKERGAKTAALLDVLSDGENHDTRELGKAAGVTRQGVGAHLNRFIKNGKVIRSGRGLYRLSATGHNYNTASDLTDAE